jgi:putative (di)nucleoside polyphosphate hydrolase
MANRPTAELPYRPCAGIVLLDQAGRVWIGHRIPKSTEDASGYLWQLPQGGIDEGESPREAALRELKEETGVNKVEIIAESSDWLTYDLPPDLVGIALKGKYRGQRLKWFAMRFLGDDGDVDISEQQGHRAEFDDWRWAKLAELPGLAIPFKRGVYEAIVAEFAHLAAR